MLLKVSSSITDVLSTFKTLHTFLPFWVHFSLQNKDWNIKTDVHQEDFNLLRPGSKPYTISSFQDNETDYLQFQPSWPKKKKENGIRP